MNGTSLDRRRSLLVLLVMALALMTVVSAVSGLNVALPSLARDTGATQAQLTWIVDAYTVVFAGLLLFAGAIGDRFGRREILLVGLLVFGAASAAAMAAPDAATLIALRAVMGLGAACIMPTTLSVITTSFPEEERPRAIGVWVGVAGGGAVLGLFATAILLEFFDWNSFFGLNVALAVLAALGTLAVVPSSRAEDAPRLDVPGALLSLLTVGGLVFGIIEGPERGWGDGWAVSGLVLGVVAGLAFVGWELRARAPMLDPRLFAVRGFSAGSLSLTVQFFAAFGFFFAALQYLQFVVGYSPLEAAVRLLPLPVVLIPLARRAPLMARRVGFRLLGPLGLLLMAAGFVVMSTVGVELTYWVFVIGVVLFAAGMALAGTPATTAITESLPPSKQGVASAVNDTAREVGSALGIAVLGSAINQAYRDGMADAVANLPADVADRVLSSIAFTSSPEIARLGAAGQALVASARQAFVDGVGSALLAGAAVLVIGAVVVFLRSPAHADAHTIPTDARRHQGRSGRPPLPEQFTRLQDATPDRITFDAAARRGVNGARVGEEPAMAIELSDDEQRVFTAVAAVEAGGEPFLQDVAREAGLDPERTRAVLSRLVHRDLVREDRTETAGGPSADLGTRYRIKDTASP